MSVLACTLCEATTKGPLPFSLPEGWASLRDTFGRWSAVCPRHKSLVSWASMKLTRAECDICGASVEFHTLWPESIITPPGWRICHGSKVCPSHETIEQGES
jgi:hypothetical protein